MFLGMFCGDCAGFAITRRGSALRGLSSGLRRGGVVPFGHITCRRPALAASLYDCCLVFSVVLCSGAQGMIPATTKFEGSAHLEHFKTGLGEIPFHAPCHLEVAIDGVCQFIEFL